MSILSAHRLFHEGVKKLREIIQRSPMALQVKARKLKTYSDKQQAEFRKFLHKREAAKDF